MTTKSSVNGVLYSSKLKLYSFARKKYENNFVVIFTRQCENIFVAMLANPLKYISLVHDVELKLIFIITQDEG
jgi:hypothetical protein